MKYLFLIITAFLGLSCGKDLLPIQFYEEEVFMRVDPGEVYVEGVYYFKNRTDTTKRMTLFYPFPVDSLHQFPYEIEVENTPFDTAINGITYDVVIQASDTAVSIVRYRQKIEINNAKYILLTARKWKEPIKEARFIISLPEDFKGINISYKPDSIINKDERFFYYITEQNLFPDRDIDIVWGAGT